MSRQSLTSSRRPPYRAGAVTSLPSNLISPFRPSPAAPRQRGGDPSVTVSGGRHRPQLSRPLLAPVAVVGRRSRGPAWPLRRLLVVTLSLLLPPGQGVWRRAGPAAPHSPASTLAPLDKPLRGPEEEEAAAAGERRAPPKRLDDAPNETEQLDGGNPSPARGHERPARLGSTE